MKTNLIAFSLLLFISCNSSSPEGNASLGKTNALMNNSANKADTASTGKGSDQVRIKDEENLIENPKAPSSNSDGKNPINRPLKKVVNKGIINFRVKKVNKTEIYLMTLIRKYNGQLIQNSQKATPKNSETIELSRDSSTKVTELDISDSMVVKVPNDNLANFLLDISKEAILVEDKEFITEDKTWEFLANQLKAENREKFAKKILSGKIHKDDLNQVLERDDERVDKLIANKMTDDDIEMSKVSLNFYENPFIFQEKIPYSEVLSYKTSFGRRMSTEFRSGLDFAEEIIFFLTKIWFFLITGFVVFFFLKRKNLKNRFFHREVTDEKKSEF